MIAKKSPRLRGGFCVKVKAANRDFLTAAGAILSLLLEVVMSDLLRKNDSRIHPRERANATPNRGSKLAMPASRSHSRTMKVPFGFNKKK